MQFGGERVLERSPWQENCGTCGHDGVGSEVKGTEIAALIEPLTHLRGRLKTEAIERGWETE